jgi:hypothetical protein
VEALIISLITRHDMKNIVLITVSKLEMKFGFTLVRRGLKEKVKN